MLSVGKYFIILTVLTVFAFADGLIRFLPYKTNEFSPVLDENFTIPFALSAPAKASAEVYTPDGALIRTLTTAAVMKEGDHTFNWDGKDNNGIVVPNEAYNIVLKAAANGKTEIVDPRKTSGGIVQRDLNPKISSDGKITYALPKPSRVLIRLGIDSGAMLRSVITWVPKNSGKNFQFWDGYDQEHLVKIQKHKDFKIIFSAFSLADFSIITTGSKSTYFDYIEKYRHEFDMSAKLYRLYHAKTKLMSPYYVRTLIDMREPRIDFVFPKTVKRNAQGIPLLKRGDKVRVKIMMNEKDALRMEKVKYEITFFDDLDFVSEEEMGYIPISWLWSPQKEKGRHMLTVNIASFKGHVGVKSTPYIIQDVSLEK